MKEKIILAVLFMLVGLLLVAQRYGFEFAGGSGFNPNRPVTFELLSGGARFVGPDGESALDASTTHLARGQKIITSDSRAVFKLNKTVILAMDENTEIELSETSNGKIVMRIFTGRIIADNSNASKPITIKTKTASAEIGDAKMSLVYYNFDELVSFIPMRGKIELVFNDGSRREIENPLNFNESNLESYIFQFYPEESVAADFYSWAESNFN